MKTKTLPPPIPATPKERAAWQIYPDEQTGAMVHPQPQNRDRIIRLASGGYGQIEILSRRQKNEVAEFNKILASITT